MQTKLMWNHIDVVLHLTVLSTAYATTYKLTKYYSEFKYKSKALSRNPPGH